MPGSNACASDPFGRTVVAKSILWREADMTGARPALSRRLRLMGAAVSLGAATMLAAVPAFARGPDAVVNSSTSQTVEAKGGGDRGAVPQLPPGSPFEEFFDDFFKNRRGGGGPK